MATAKFQKNNLVLFPPFCCSGIYYVFFRDSPMICRALSSFVHGWNQGLFPSPWCQSRGQKIIGVKKWWYVAHCIAAAVILLLLLSSFKKQLPISFYAVLVTLSQIHIFSQLFNQSKPIQIFHILLSVSKSVQQSLSLFIRLFCQAVVSLS